MPSLRIFRTAACSLSTRPFGQDDLHCLCVGLGVFRVLQLVILLFMWIYLYVKKWEQEGGELPDWCKPLEEPSESAQQQGGDYYYNYESVPPTGSEGGESLRWLRLLASVVAETTSYNNNETTAPETDSISNTSSSSSAGAAQDLNLINETNQFPQYKRGRRWLIAYVALSVAYSVIDFAVLASIYSAASVGTPADPMGREIFLRPLLRFKVGFMNLLLVVLVVMGIMMVYYNRQGNWGCHDGADGIEYNDGLEDTVWFVFFSTFPSLVAFDISVLLSNFSCPLRSISVPLIFCSLFIW